VIVELDLPRQLDPARPPVVLLGGINLVRSLGMAGIPAVVASTDADDPAFASRYCRGRCVLPAFDSGNLAANALVSLGDRLASMCGRRIPLMYGSDDSLNLIHAHRERLQRYFLFLVSDAEVGDALIAKDRFQALGLERGLPVPRALDWCATGPGSVAAVKSEVLVKPRIKVEWHRSALHNQLFGGDGKARIFASGAQARAHPVVERFRDQLTFQEYIPGDDRCLWSFHGFADEDGEVLASFVGRKLRTYPALTGESAFIEMARDEELSRLGREVARRCPLKGVFKMDFKRDARDGTWHLLEINARFNLWHYLGAANGLNLMAIAYEFLVNGARPAAADYGTRLRWLALNLDRKAFRELARRGEITLGGWLASLAFSRKIYNVFAWTDPGPWWRFWSTRLSGRWDRGTNRFRAALRQWRSTAS
jgi:predicted ATP-grasp superfamily ATP-dependent carboligase